MQAMAGGLVLAGVLTLALAAGAHQGGKPDNQAGAEHQVQATPELVARGKAIFAQRCSVCHHAKSQQSKVGPGLKGLFEAKLTPIMRYPVTDANIRGHIQKGGKNMPALPDIKGQEMDSLIAFLKTL